MALIAKKIDKEIAEPKEFIGKLICRTGPKKGSFYYLKNSRVVLGRSKDVEIQVMDQKTSREHAEVVKKNGNYIITDLKSQNGVIVNDLKITQYTLKNLDKIIIGQTVYQFILEELKEGIALDNSGMLSNDDESLEKKENNKKGQNRIIIIVATFFVMVLIFGEGSKDNTGANKKRIRLNRNDVSDELTKIIERNKLSEDQELNKKLQIIFQRGQREFREKNYFRALNEFNLALILSPKHPLAEFYRDKTKQALDQEIESFFKKAAQDVDGLRYSKAMVSYCAIIRLIQNYPEDSRYKDALTNLKEVAKRYGLEENEVNCFQK